MIEDRINIYAGRSHLCRLWNISNANDSRQWRPSPHSGLVEERSHTIPTNFPIFLRTYFAPLVFIPAVFFSRGTWPLEGFTYVIHASWSRQQFKIYELTRRHWRVMSTVFNEPWRNTENTEIIRWIILKNIYIFLHIQCHTCIPM